jgi:hypothetical protein
VHHSTSDDSPGPLSPGTFFCLLFDASQDSHNRIVQVLDDLPSEGLEDLAVGEDFEDEIPVITRPSRFAAPVLRPGVTPALRALNENTRAPDPPKLAEARPTLKIPVTSLRTPPELVRQRLLIYDRYSPIPAPALAPAPLHIS